IYGFSGGENRGRCALRTHETRAALTCILTTGTGKPCVPFSIIPPRPPCNIVYRERVKGDVRHGRLPASRHLEGHLVDVGDNGIMAGHISRVDDRQSVGVNDRACKRVDAPETTPAAWAYGVSPRLAPER